jgi:hypothetical protein
VEVEMPWFPDFVAAVELARRQTRSAGQADPVAQYFTALDKGDAHALEAVWPGEIVIYDPPPARSAATNSCGGSSAKIKSGWLLVAARVYDDVEAPVGRS